MQKPLVSIVTPSFNQGRFIRSTIESVLSQDYPRIEYIIMDGGSTDETVAIAGEYGDRLTLISEKDRGQSHAINKGFGMARGEFVAWLNSDDIILPGAVAKAVEGFEVNPYAGAVYGEGYIIDEAGNVKDRFPATEPFNLWKLIHLSDYILQQTVYFRRCVLEEVGLLDEGLNWGLDWDLLIRVGKKYHLQYLAADMGSIREYDAAKTLSGGRARLRELVSIMRTHGQMRYPPGYFTYGLDTFFRLLRPFVPFASWRSALSHAVYGFIGRIHRLAVKRQGFYSDGWAGPHLRWMLPAGSGTIRVSGHAPAGVPSKRQALTVYCDGLLVAQYAFGIGNFDLQFDYPGTVAKDPVFVEIKAATAFTPKGDGRKLAYVLKRIEWSSAAMPRAKRQSPQVQPKDHGEETARLH